jgi:erythromycin esterase-like protein
MMQRLIEEKGFCAVAAEADWPDAYRVNRYVRGRSDDATAEEALRGFERFPAWTWRNGFYGLDLYSLYRSIHEVIAYPERVDGAAAARARERYSCFEISFDAAPRAADALGTARLERPGADRADGPLGAGRGARDLSVRRPMPAT